MAEHTPLPWVLDHSEPCRGRIYCDDATGSIVASCVDFKWAPRPAAEQEANASLIVTAVNSHRELIDSVIEFLEPYHDKDDAQIFEKLPGSEAQRVARARKLLTKLGVEL